MSKQVEVLGLGYVLTELRETREVLEHKYFEVADLELIREVDQLKDDNLLNLTLPISLEAEAEVLV